MKVPLIKPESNENSMNSFQCGKTKIVAIGINIKDNEKELKFFNIKN